MNLLKKMLTGLLCLELLCPLTACNSFPQADSATEHYQYNWDGDVNICYRSAGFGSITGNTDQLLTADHPSSDRIEAVGALGYSFSHWSDGSQSAVREGDSFSKDTVLTAYFVPEQLSMPLLSITVECDRTAITKTSYVSGTATLSGCDEKYQLNDFPLEIKGRGHGSWTYDKKGWRLKLSSQRNLLGIGEGSAKTWILVANHIDRSLLRNAACTWTQKQASAIDYFPSYAFVELYLNGEYMGVYQLYETIEVAAHKIDLTESISNAQTSMEDIGFLVEMSNYASGDGAFSCSGLKYEVCSDMPELPDEYSAALNSIQRYIDKCYTAVLGGDQTEIESLIDIESAVDTYIIEELFKNLDVGWASFFFTRKEGGKLIFGPIWDFDLSAGNANADISSIGYSEFPLPTGLYVGNAAIRDRQSNAWYLALMQQDWFVQLVCQRWQVLSANFNRLPELIRSTADAYMPSLLRNFEKWDILNGIALSRESDAVLDITDYSEQVNYFACWMEQRIKWLNEQWVAP